MEVTPYIQDVRGHADSLLASLNLQRDLAQFCDCVIRQSSAQLFLAHRCVLAASSPVLASLLASNGTLLELQVPCLSDSVLRLVLDYIYTGDLPPPAAQQQYCSLLTAASYLHMDKLQQDLEARQGTDTDDGDNNLTTSSTPAKHCSRIMNDQPFSEDVYSEHTAVEIYTSLCENSMGQQDHAFSAQTCDETHSAKRSSCLACNGNNCSSGSDVLLNTTGADDLMGALGRKENGGELRSAATDDPEGAPRSTGELGPSRRQCSRAREACQASSSFSNGLSVHHHRGGGERSPTSSSSSFSNGPSVHHHRGGGERSPTSSSSSPLSCSAVPVICHSGRATMLQPAETATLPHFCPGLRSSSGASIPSGAPVPPPQPASPKEGTHSNASGAGFKDVNRPLAPNQHGGVGTQSWNFNEQSLDGCGIQNFYFHHRGKAHFGVRHEDNYSTECGLTPRTDVKDHLVHCESLRCDDDTKHPSDDALPPHEDYKTEPNAEDYKDSDDEKRPPVGYFYVSTTTAEAWKRGSNIGTCEHQYDHCFEGRKERERDGNLHRTESRMDHVTCGHLNPSRKHERPERESHTALAGDTSYDPTYSYGGHLQNQEYTQQTHALSYTHPESQYPQHSRHTHPPPDHSNLPGEWGVGVGTRSGLNRSPLTQPWSGVAKEQLFLLDISTAPARYLVSHEAGGGEGRAELQTGDGVVGGAVDRGIGAQVCRGLDDYSDGRVASPREESSTDSSAVTDGEERGPSTMPPDLPVYTSSAPATPSPTTSLVSAPRCSAVAAVIGASQALLLQHPYHCTLCDRSFSQRGSLNRHMRSHLGVRPYPCPRCPMTFSRQYRVTEHMRVHQRCGPDEELQKPPAPPT